MRRADVLRTAPMSRVAIVTTPIRLRAALVEVADSGLVQLDIETDVENDATAALRTLAAPPVPPRLTREPIGTATLVRRGRRDLLGGEVDVARHATAAVTREGLSATAGWMPSAGVELLDRQLRTRGAAVVELPRPAWQEPPTLLPAGPVSNQLRPLIDMYGAVPYADVNPALFAAFTYVLMFGMMFADAGQGLLLAAAGVWALLSRRRRARSLRRVWFYLVACGLSATAFGAAFGEFFGPTGVIPPLWLAPLEEPLRIIVVALGIGAVLLAASYTLGTLNRLRESGPAVAATSASGAAGMLLFIGAALAAGGLVLSVTALLWAGVGLAFAALALIGTGIVLESHRGTGGLAEAVVASFDALLRVGTNIISFTRLAAFGLVHAAIGALVWQQATALWGRGALGFIAAALVFVLGNALAFALEGLVAGVQALRLEYYELFSRVFVGQGRHFVPWHIPVVSEDLSS